MRNHRDPEAELAALADGSLPPERRAEVEAQVAASPELAALFAEQQRALQLIRAAAVDAPGRLRARIEAGRRSRARRRRFAYGGGLALAAAAAVALLVSLPGGVGGPTLAQAAALSTRAAEQGPPPPQAGEPKLLARSADGVPFPNWLPKFGWRAAGARTDRIDGRDTVTVFYRKGGKLIGYTIVSGKALDVPDDAGRARREGTLLRTFRNDSRPAVTWLREGHTCVLAGAGVPRPILLKLAAWKGKGAVRF
jgi:anti-sigma factor RsiW